MNQLKLIKYPGAKNVLLPKIIELFRDSKAEVFVDVFGGSGIVALNVEASKIIYNDLNEDLANLFSVIKSYPNLLLELMNKWTSTKEMFQEYNEIYKSRGQVNLNKVERAFKTFYTFNVGFGGMGSTYRTKKEKSSYSSIRKIVANFGSIASKIQSWSIECLDFRQVFSKYDNLKTFFYCDPPYTSKEWYEFDFGESDLKELKEITSKIKGYSLVSSDSDDQIVKDIFGEPDLMVKFENQNRKKISPPIFRRYSLYLKDGK